MNDEELKRKILEAEREGLVPRLYRLWCEHAISSNAILKNDELVLCEECGTGQPVMYRITPQAEPDLWPDWRNPPCTTEIRP
jgi:hypothetical protein